MWGPRYADFGTILASTRGRFLARIMHARVGTLRACDASAMPARFGTSLALAPAVPCIIPAPGGYQACMIRRGYRACALARNLLASSSDTLASLTSVRLARWLRIRCPAMPRPVARRACAPMPLRGAPVRARDRRCVPPVIPCIGAAVVRPWDRASGGSAIGGSVASAPLRPLLLAVSLA